MLFAAVHVIALRLMPARYYMLLLLRHAFTRCRLLRRYIMPERVFASLVMPLLYFSHAMLRRCCRYAPLEFLPPMPPLIRHRAYVLLQLTLYYTRYEQET